jgi:hypothetical protein
MYIGATRYVGVQIAGTTDADCGRIPENTRYHFSLTRNGSVCTLYINAVVSTAMSISTSTEITQNENFSFGRNNTAYANFPIVDMLIHNRALSPGENTVLADPSKLLYVPDTRTRFYAPLVTGWKPWLRHRQRHRLGA